MLIYSLVFEADFLKSAFYFKNSEYSIEPIVMPEIKLTHSFVISVDDIF